MANATTHLIRSDEVDGWLADSYLDTTAVHRTTHAAAESLIESGVRVEKTSAEGAWGQGFYASTREDEQYGDVRVRVAIKLVKPLVIDDPIGGYETIEVLRQRAATEDIREAVLAAGFDGIVINWGPGDQWIVAMLDGQVKIVVEE